MTDKQMTPRWELSQERDIDGFFFIRKLPGGGAEVYPNPRAAEPRQGAWLIFGRRRDAQAFADKLNDCALPPGGRTDE